MKNKLLLSLLIVSSLALTGEPVITASAASPVYVASTVSASKRKASKSSKNTAKKVPGVQILRFTCPKDADITFDAVYLGSRGGSCYGKRFSVFIPYGETYFIKDDLSGKTLKSGIKVGDDLIISAKTYSDGSIDTDSVSVKAAGTHHDDIVAEYKASCPDMDYEAIVRKPTRAWGTVCHLRGTVEQVVSVDDDAEEFMVSDKDGNFVNVKYYLSKNSDRILEDDTVDVYGMFYKMYDYVSIFGESKSVPRIIADYVDIS